LRLEKLLSSLFSLLSSLFSAFEIEEENPYLYKMLM